VKQSLQLRLGQQLTMTPQLQQAIRLLQLSTLELQMEVQQALESNLMLEEAEEAEEDHGAPDESSDEARGNGDAAEAGLDGTLGSEYEPADIPEDLPVDSAWDDVYESLAATGGPSPPAESNGYDLDNQRGSSESLREHLQWQLSLSHLGEDDLAVAAAIIDAVDDDGYVMTPLEDIALSVAGDEDTPESDEMEAVLHHLQNFDPPGVCARDLRECLLIQLRQLDPELRWRDEAIALVDEHIGLLAAHDYQTLMRRLELDSGALQQVIAVIQSMNPRPGTKVSEATTEYVVPDVYVSKRNGVWQVELNQESLPKLRINPQYASLIRRADNSADNNCLKAHMQEARWFIKSLKSRSETLLKVARCIVERQAAFLEHGAEAMKPMVLHDVAEAVDMHESTISRVTNQKYMHTPRGIFELKYFFSSHLSTRSGGEASSTAIRALLKKLIAAENPGKPLSDSKLAEILSGQGINVARRTVAKYREAMIIPSSNERKRLV